MPDPGSCPNCGRRHEAPPTPFCPGCGQETTLRPPTLGEFAQQFGGSYLSTEGALWRTLKLLVTRPGALTREYLAGRRRHYVLPLRLYLTASVVALVALRLASSGAAIELPPETAAELARAGKNELVIALGGDQGPRLGLANGKFYCERLPAALCHHFQRKLDLDPKAMSRELERASERFVGHWGTAMFLLVPMFALWCKLAWLARRLRYTEHLVFALHLHAVWFLLLALMLPGLAALTAPAMLAVPVYGWLSLRRVHGGYYRAARSHTDRA